MNESSVSTWIHDWKSGDSEAAEKLWERYWSRLIALAVDRLRNSPKRLADEEDLVLAVFEEFLRKARQGTFPRLESRDDLWQIVVQITERRAIDQFRKANTYHRRVAGESTFHLPDNAERSHTRGLDAATDVDVSPEDAFAFAEEFSALMRKLANEELRAVARCRLAGMTDNEIAKQLQCSLRTVERRLGQIRSAWADLLPPRKPQLPKQ